jgi:hypothetical protein
MKQKIEIKRLEGNWFRGSYKGYEFCAKVYAEPSHYGINEGCVSKLSVTKNDKWVFNYDRGMDLDHKIGHEIAKVLDQNVKSLF